MEASGWVAIIGAVFVGLLQLANMLFSYLRDRDKARALRSIQTNLDNNTDLTMAGTSAAARNAKQAADAASAAKDATENISKKLNGGIDEAIKSAVRPVQEVLEAHIHKDAADLAEIKAKIDANTQYIHDRNHDILSALDGLPNKLDLVSRARDEDRKK